MLAGAFVFVGVTTGPVDTDSSPDRAPDVVELIEVSLRDLFDQIFGPDPVVVGMND